MQEVNLNLPPWEVAPAQIDHPDDTDFDFYHPDEPRTEQRPHGRDGRREAAALLKRMLAFGVSKWHPDPLRACEEAERKAAT